MTTPTPESRQRKLTTALALALAAALGACSDKPAQQAATPGPGGPGTAKAPAAATPAPGAPAAAAAAAAPPAAASAAPAATGPEADARLASEVSRALRAHPDLGRLPIDPKASGGVVTLFGNASTDEERRKVVEFVGALPGVKSVENRIGLVRGS